MRLDSLLTSILPTPLTVSALLLCLASALVLGILTALVFTRGCRHTASFALTLALLPMSVALVIMMVNGSIGTGLAVAGTFALVRFRSVPGKAREIAAIFTAVAMGLAMGMGMLGVAVVFFLLAAAAVLVLTKLHFGAMPENAKVLRITVPEDVELQAVLIPQIREENREVAVALAKVVQQRFRGDGARQIHLIGQFKQRAHAFGAYLFQRRRHMVRAENVGQCGFVVHIRQPNKSYQ